MTLSASPSPRREKWPWLPVLFLKAKARCAAPDEPAPRPAVDACTPGLLRLIAETLPRCAPAGTDARAELDDISDRLEELAGGLSEQAWAEALAADLARRRRDGAPVRKVRVTWG